MATQMGDESNVVNFNISYISFPYHLKQQPLKVLVVLQAAEYLPFELVADKLHDRHRVLLTRPMRPLVCLEVEFGSINRPVPYHCLSCVEIKSMRHCAWVGDEQSQITLSGLESLKYTRTDRGGDFAIDNLARYLGFKLPIQHVDHTRQGHKAQYFSGRVGNDLSQFRQSRRRVDVMHEAIAVVDRAKR